MTIERAIAFAALKHQGQLDKAGIPYIFHPMRVMLLVHPFGDEAAQAAVLHDVIEDCNVTEIELAEEGFSIRVIEAVVALTRIMDPVKEDYFDFINRCKLNPLARMIKNADIMDNMSRMQNINSASKVEGLVRRYNKAIMMLNS